MTIQNIKQVTARANVPRRSRAQGLSIAQLHGEHLPEHLDPFLAFDHFEMSQPFFPPHPQIANELPDSPISRTADDVRFAV